MTHVSVLLHEAIEGLNIRNSGVYVDGTVGNGGHSEAILLANESVKVIAFDLDEDALRRSRERLAHFGERITFIHDSFRNIKKVIANQRIEIIDGVIFDFGLSSNQIEESGRGFSFQTDEPLVMTFRKETSESTLTAKDVVNTWSEESLKTIIKGFGEERFAGRIARVIAERRLHKPFETTGELVQAIESAVPGFYRKGRIHPATRTFQAIRMAVNDELRAIEEGLAGGFGVLGPKGRMVAISFHSLEDRIVKRYFRNLQSEGQVELITKKPIVPTPAEIKENPRSRSAKLRIFEKI
jgi:16S rRNA (cytosine1402-N4)-methyltransferase